MDILFWGKNPLSLCTYQNVRVCINSLALYLKIELCHRSSKNGRFNNSNFFSFHSLALICEHFVFIELVTYVLDTYYRV